MITYILILFVHAAGVHPGAITSVPGFSSIDECHIAGEMVKNELEGARQSVSYECVLQFKSDDK